MTIRLFAAATVGVLTFAATACAAGPAQAAGWRLDPRLCPDLVEDARDRREDRRDSRIDRGPRDRAEDRGDRRENRRDERVTVCPRSAWVWSGPPARAARPPAAAVVYFDPIGGRYFRYGPRRTRVFIAVR